jgi:hypothetical protein
VVIGGAGFYTVTDNGGTNGFSYDSLTISDLDATLAMGSGVSLDITGTGTTALDSSGTITLAGGTINDAGGLIETVVGFGHITAAAEFGGTIETQSGTINITCETCRSDRPARRQVSMVNAHLTEWRRT